MSSQPAAVSVAIPVYNGAAYIGEAIDSVLAQTLPPAEFLVFDNASTDQSVKIAQSRLPAGDVRVSATNQGAIANFRRSIADTHQPYFMWVAADDRLRPEFIERTLAALETHPERPACLTGIQYIDPAGNPGRVQTDEALGSLRLRRRLSSFLRRARWTEFYCLYRRSALLASPGVFDEYASDVLFTWWLLLRSPLVIVTEPLLEYREFPTKTVADMAEAQHPGAPREHWRKMQLWRRLWEISGERSLSPRVRRAAHLELCLLPLHRTAWVHLAEDVLERWPVLRRAISRLRAVQS